MCSACPSAYGGGSYSSGLKRKENDTIRILKSYTIKERIQQVINYHNKYQFYIFHIY